MEVVRKAIKIKMSAICFRGNRCFRASAVRSFCSDPAFSNSAGSQSSSSSNHNNNDNNNNNNNNDGQQRIWEMAVPQQIMIYKRSIIGNLHKKQNDEALKWWKRLCECGKPDPRFCVEIFRAIAKVNPPGEGESNAALKQLFESWRWQVDKFGVGMSAKCYNAIIVSVAEIDPDCAVKYFQMMKDNKKLKTNKMTYGGLISGFAKHGDCDRAIEYHNLMQLDGIAPNAHTFSMVLSALS